MVDHGFLQGGDRYKWRDRWPLRNGHINWVTGVITPINGVRTPLITCRGPPCIAI